MRLDHLLSREKWKRPGKQAGREAREGGTEGGRRTDPNPRSNGREAESERNVVKTAKREAKSERGAVKAAKRKRKAERTKDGRPRAQERKIERSEGKEKEAVRPRKYELTQKEREAEAMRKRSGNGAGNQTLHCIVLKARVVTRARGISSAGRARALQA